MTIPVEKFKLVIVKNSPTVWKLENRFTGWYDSKLCENAVDDAKEIGKALKVAKLQFDVAHTSVLKRAHESLKHILQEIGQPEITVSKTWRLNQQHCGNITGLTEKESVERYGKQEHELWQRNYSIAPPPMTPQHPFYKEIVNDQRYEYAFDLKEFPMCESLKNVVTRTIPYYEKVIKPQILEGKRLLIVTHDATIKGLVQHIFKLRDEEAANLLIPNARPIIVKMNECLEPIAHVYFDMYDSIKKDLFKFPEDRMIV